MLVAHPSRSSGCYATGIVCLPAFLFVPEHVWAQKCVGSPLAVQVLGSGGPRINPLRASAGYVLWVDSEARMLVDVGGGTFARFGQSEANFIDLSLVAISHLHPDHVSDLPALLWTSQNLRTAPLPISGPSGNDVVPGFPVFLSRLFDEKVGAFPMLGSIISGRQGAGGGVPLQVGVVDVTKKSPSTVFEHEGFRVTAQGIPHGNIPALAYRVDTRGRSVVFAPIRTAPIRVHRVRQRCRCLGHALGDCCWDDQSPPCLACGCGAGCPRCRGQAAHREPHRSIPTS